MKGSPVYSCETSASSLQTGTSFPFPSDACTKCLQVLSAAEAAGEQQGPGGVSASDSEARVAARQLKLNK